MTIDIVMPFYGDPALFRIAVESVLAQHDDRWRLTVIDDAYPDEEPGRWFAGLAELDDRLAYVRHASNRGVGETFAHAVSLFDAERGVILGCDDELLPDFVGHAHALALRFPEAHILQAGVEVIDETGAVVRPLGDRVKALCAPRGPHPFTMTGEHLAASLLRASWTYFPSLVWRRELFDRHPFRTELHVVLDLDAVFRMVRDGAVLAVDDTVTFRYRRHSASVSSWRASDGSRFTEEGDFFARAAAECARAGWPRAARAARAHWTSRLHAATRLPDAVAARDRRGLGTLLRYLVAPGR